MEDSSSDHRRPRVLVGITGSVAAVKGPEIVTQLVDTVGCDVQVVLTHTAETFWTKAPEYNKKEWTAFEAKRKESSPYKASIVAVHDSKAEWQSWKRLGDTVLHIALRDWADMVVLAPLSAHTLAKLATGLCDDLISSILRAWDFNKPIVLAPAMNTDMWNHPITASQLRIVQSFSTHDNITIVDPQSKELACGQVGKGALASVDVVVASVQKAIDASKRGGTNKVNAKQDVSMKDKIGPGTAERSTSKDANPNGRSTSAPRNEEAFFAPTNNPLFRFES